MNLGLTIGGVVAGLAGGGLVGYQMGVRVRESRSWYWALNLAVVLGCAALNFAGLVTGSSWFAYSALGLMGGLITGMKYGYSDWLRAWPDSHSTNVSEDVPTEPAAESAEEPASESAD